MHTEACCRWDGHASSGHNFANQHMVALHEGCMSLQDVTLLTLARTAWLLFTTS
jgi:hypothetical protein